MQGSRTETIKHKKPRIIIDKTFPIFKELEVGDIGQIKLKGIIEGERLEMCEDDTERLLKVIKVLDLELVNKKENRQYA